jgi:hypothetical protein
VRQCAFNQGLGFRVLGSEAIFLLSGLRVLGQDPRQYSFYLLELTPRNEIHEFNSLRVGAAACAVTDPHMSTPAGTSVRPSLQGCITWKRQCRRRLSRRPEPRLCQGKPLSRNLLPRVLHRKFSAKEEAMLRPEAPLCRFENI